MSHELVHPEWPLVVAYRLGVNSTALLVECANRGITPGLILFADTGGEKPETYAYLPVIQDYLNAVNFPAVATVRYEPKWAAYHTLEDQCLHTGTRDRAGRPAQAHVRRRSRAVVPGGRFSDGRRSHAAVPGVRRVTFERRHQAGACRHTGATASHQFAFECFARQVRRSTRETGSDPTVASQFRLNSLHAN